MKMSMIADFKLHRKNKETSFFKPMSREDFDSFSPGGFTFEVDGKAIPFDWDAQSTSEENGVFHYESGYGPFFNDFEIPEGCWDEEYEALGLKREEISPELLSSVTNIQEFYVNFVLKGEDDDDGIGDNEDPNSEYAIELLSIAFEERETGNAFAVDEKVLEKFNGKIIIDNKKEK